MTGADSGADPGARPGWRWDVALSFAGAQRDYVEQVAAVLKARGVGCFYDVDEQTELWGRYLAEELPAIYGEQAAAVVMFVSAEYAAREWTRLERRAALARAVRERRDYVLPARFDDTPLPGLPSDMATVDLRTRTPQQFAAMIAGKLAALAASAASADAGGCAPERPVGRVAGRARRPGRGRIDPAPRPMPTMGKPPGGWPSHRRPGDQDPLASPKPRNFAVRDYRRWLLREGPIKRSVVYASSALTAIDDFYLSAASARRRSTGTTCPAGTPRWRRRPGSASCARSSRSPHRATGASPSSPATPAPASAKSCAWTSATCAAQPAKASRASTARATRSARSLSTSNSGPSLSSD
jgi:hypothetical protein